MADKNIVWETSAGRLTLCPLHGRVLQAEVNDIKAFWNNPNYSGDWNVGGDRIWVAPEVDFNWTTLEEVDFQKYIIQESMDPGSWEIEKEGDNYCRIQQNVTMKHLNHDSVSKLQLSRQVTGLEGFDKSYFESALAYRTDNELTLFEQSADRKIGMWYLLQVPAGGKMYIAGRGGITFRDYFTPIPSELWENQNNIMCFDITGKNQYKLGISAGHLVGRQAYVRQVEGKFLVIYRQFFPQALADYCDVPMDDLAGPGDAVQIYCDDGSFGGFGEMEYHSPCIKSSDGNDSLNDTSFTIVGLVKPENMLQWIEYWLR